MVLDAAGELKELLILIFHDEQTRQIIMAFKDRWWDAIPPDEQEELKYSVGSQISIDVVIAVLLAAFTAGSAGVTYGSAKWGQSIGRLGGGLVKLLDNLEDAFKKLAKALKKRKRKTFDLNRQPDRKKRIETKWKGARSAEQDRHIIATLAAEGRINEARFILKPYVDKGDVKGIVDRLDVGGVPKDKGALWSGNKEGARAAAARDGKVIMEETNGGKVIDNWDYLDQKMPWDKGGKDVWGGVSEKYAGQLKGEVSVYQTSEAAAKGGGYTFKTFEEPVIRANKSKGLVTNIIYKAL